MSLRNREYTIKPIDFTGMSISQSTTHTSQQTTLIIFKMDDDGSALRVGAKYKSFTDLECALNKFQQDNYVQLYKRNSRKLDYSCIHGGNNFSSISNGQRPNTR